MSYVLRCDLDPWRWGFIVIQEAYQADGREFCSLMRAAGANEKDLALYWDGYQKMSNSGGYCFVPDHPTPWLICVFSDNWRDVLKGFVHEVVHLGEHLPAKENVASGFPTQEVRAAIVAKAFDIFYTDYTQRWMETPPAPPAPYLQIGAMAMALVLFGGFAWAAYHEPPFFKRLMEQQTASAPPAARVPETPPAVARLPETPPPVARVPDPPASVAPPAIRLPNVGDVVLQGLPTMGMWFENLTPELRRQVGIKDGVKGVLIYAVDPKSTAAEKRLEPGDVIGEVQSEPVSTPAQVLTRVGQLKTEGKKLVMLFVTKKDGNNHFVMLPLSEASGWVPAPRDESLGLTLQPLTLEMRRKFQITHRDAFAGVVVTSVSPGSPASSKVAVGDVITKVEFEEVESPDRVRAIIGKALAIKSESVVLSVIRKGSYTDRVISLQ